MLWGKPLEFTGPGDSFTIALPKEWSADTKGDTATFRAKRGVGILRITAWKTSHEAGGLDGFLARQEAKFSTLVDSERKILAAEQINMKDRKGLFRISLAEEDGAPLIVTMYILAGGSTAVMATYSVSGDAFGTPEGKAESKLITDAILRMSLR